MTAMTKRLAVLCLAMALLITACDNETKKPTQAPVETTEVEKDLIGMLSDSIAKNENRDDLYLQRAKAYVEQEQVGAAMVDVTKAIEVNPKNIDAFLMLADIYYMLGDQANITATLNRALEADPYDSRPMVKLAEINMLQQNYDLALGYIDNALKVSTFNPRAYFVRGMIYMAKQDTTAALRHLLTSREQDADFFDPCYEVCKIYNAQNSPLAEPFLRSTVSHFPEQPLARYELALYLQDHDKPEEALLHYDTLLSMQPGNSRLLFNKGYVYFVYLGDNQKALDYFSQALDNDPNYLDALYNKGHVLEQMGDYVQAKTIYSQVLKIKPNYELAVKAINRISNQMEE